MEPTLEESKISLTNIHKSMISKTSLWIIKTPKVMLKPSEILKTKIYSSTYQDKFHNILEHYLNYLYTLTDDSKDNDKTVWTAILDKTIIRKALPKENSIFTAEALNIISESGSKNFIIFSDLLTILLAFKNIKLEKTLIIKLLNKLDSMSHSKKILICWMLNHIWERENESADSVAK